MSSLVGKVAFHVLDTEGRETPLGAPAPLHPLPDVLKFTGTLTGVTILPRSARHPATNIGE